jgi:hypothetical protein
MDKAKCCKVRAVAPPELSAHVRKKFGHSWPRKARGQSGEGHRTWRGADGSCCCIRGPSRRPRVDVLEATGTPGGMGAHFDFGGISIERFYHFVCREDHPTFELLKDLGIADKLH